MLSFLSILLSFQVILVFLSRSQVIADVTSRVVSSFIGALSFLSSIYFCFLLIPNCSILTFRVAFLLILFVLGVSIYLNRSYVKMAMSDLSTVSGWSITTGDDEFKMFTELQLRKGRSLYRLVFVTACSIIIVVNILNPSPANYDSNTYNVARVASMIAEGSPFLQQTSVMRQVFFPVSHDLLFYPDILFNNTRGLGLVCGLEYIVLMCMLSQIALHFIGRLRRSSIPVIDISVYPALLLALCLLLTSDLQSMQSVITKNDLIITLCFVCGLYLTAKYMSNEISVFTLAACSLLIIVYSLSSKSYGIISIMPLGSSLIFPLVKLRHLLFKPKINTWFTFNMFQSRIIGLFRSISMEPMRLLWLGMLVVISISQLYMNSSIKKFAGDEYTLELSQEMQSWGNIGNGLQESFFISIVNFARNTLSLILYPFMSMPVLGSRLYSRLTKIFDFDFLSSDIGIGGNTSFQWPGYDQDTAYTSILVLSSIVFSWIVWRKLSAYYSVYVLPGMTPLNGDLSKLFVVIIANCMLAYIVITFAILYQPWIGRFMGPAYVPLIPVASFILAQFYHLHRNKSYVLRLLFFIRFSLPFIALFSLFMHVGTSALTNDVSLTFSSSYAKIPLSERRYVKHVSQLTSTKPSSYIPLLEHLRDSDFKQRFICSGGDSWILTPMISSMSNESFNGSNLSSLPVNVCNDSIGIEHKLKDSSVNHGSLPARIIIKNDAEYLYLP